MKVALLLVATLAIFLVVSTQPSNAEEANDYGIDNTYASDQATRDAKKEARKSGEGKPGKPEKSEKGGKPDKVGKPEKTGKPDKTGKPEKTGKPDKAGKKE